MKCSVCGAERNNLIPVRKDIEEINEDLQETFFLGWEVKEVCLECYEADNGDYDIVIFDENVGGKHNASKNPLPYV